MATARWSPHIRPSRTKEKTISLDEQERAITSWAKAHGIELATPIIEQKRFGGRSPGARGRWARP
jgi:hypothetical protein